MSLSIDNSPLLASARNLLNDIKIDAEQQFYRLGTQFEQVASKNRAARERINNLENRIQSDLQLIKKLHKIAEDEHQKFLAYLCYPCNFMSLSVQKLLSTIKAIFNNVADFFRDRCPCCCPSSTCR